QEGHQRVAGISLRPRCLIVIAAELAFQHSIKVLYFLLFAEVNAVVGQLPPPRLLLPRGRVAALDRAFRSIAAVSLEKQLHAVAAANSTNGSGVSCHGSCGLV